MAHDVFISHSHRDKSVADAACAILERRGLRCWIAPRDIAPGLEWAEAIIGGINRGASYALEFPRVHLLALDSAGLVIEEAARAAFRNDRAEAFPARRFRFRASPDGDIRSLRIVADGFIAPVLPAADYALQVGEVRPRPPYKPAVLPESIAVRRLGRRGREDR